MTLNTRTLISLEGKSVWASQDQVATIAALIETRKGGFARIYGYTATSGRTVPTVYDTTVTTRFSYKRLVARKRAALESLTLADVRPHLRGKALLADDATLERDWNARKAETLASFDATGNDDRESTAQREAHDRCYMNLAEGVVVHYVTEYANGEKIKTPVLLDGHPMVDSIMLNVLEVSRTVREAGQYKVVNSGVPVCITNAINATLKAQGIRSMKRVSLKVDNFERVVIDNTTILPEDIVQLAEAA